MLENIEFLTWPNLKLTLEDGTELTAHLNDRNRHRFDLIEEFPRLEREDGNLSHGLLVGKDEHGHEIMIVCSLEVSKAPPRETDSDAFDFMKALSEMPRAERDRLLRGVSDVLSGLDIGENEAFDFLAKLEKHVIGLNK